MSNSPLERSHPSTPVPAENPTQHRGGGGMNCLDVITVLFLLASVAIISATVLIINDPAVPFNPFPKPTLPQLVEFPTAGPTTTPSSTPTETVTPLPPTPFPTFTPTSTFTPTASPTITPTLVIQGAAATIDPSLPADAQPGLNLVTPTTEIISAFPFIARDVRYEANLNTQGCQWLSIAGNVTGTSGEPLTDLAIEVIGDGYQKILFSGSAQQFGLSGFEFPVGTTPRRLEFSVQLLNSTGVPISDFIFVTTGETCADNVAVVEFVQTRPYE
ncbi:MAG: hypothetical protein HY862_10230 [Chloroflexi bacterium]|nr:hypothetical protein [Chloroflexota bacterium]